MAKKRGVNGEIDESSLHFMQREAIRKILVRLDENVSGEGSMSKVSAGNVSTGQQLGQKLTQNKISQWKVLILDEWARELMTPLFKIGDLRSFGVTLVLNIEDRKREEIPDAPAIYLVKPTQNNIDIIVRDCENELYESMHLNFTSRISRSLLEDFGTKVSALDAHSSIKSVYDQLLNFKCVERNMFTLGRKDALSKTMNPSIKELSEIEPFLDEIAEGIVSVVLTMGVFPLIACEKNQNPATMIAKLVKKKLNQHFNSNNPSIQSILLVNQKLKKRPVLIIADRSMDYSICLQHRWTYRALLHDMFQYKNNSITAPIKKSKNEPDKELRKFDIEYEKDNFWKEHASHDYPIVATEVGKTLQAYEKEQKKFNDKTQQGNDENGINFSKSTVSEAFKLAEQKQFIDMHTLLCRSILDELDDRKLDEFQALEEALRAKKIFNEEEKQLLMDLMKSKGTHSDRIRLLLICFLALQQYPDEDFPFTSQDLETLENELEKLRTHDDSQENPHLPELSFLRSTIIRPQMWFDDETQRKTKFSKITSGVISSFNVLGTQLKSIASGLKGSGLTQFVPLPLTQFCHCILNPTEENDYISKLSQNYKDKYIILDPKKESNEPNLSSGSFESAIVFVFGGGNFTEYENLLQYSKSSPTPIQFTYGSSEIINGEEFLLQLRELGENL